MTDMRASAGYRAASPANLLLRFYLETRAARPRPAVGGVNDFGGTRLMRRRRPGATPGRRRPARPCRMTAPPARRRRGGLCRRHPGTAGTLHLALGLGPQAHARIAASISSAVKAAPGVVAVLTAADIPGQERFGPVVADDPVLADGLVQYAGQPVFAVAAESRRPQARAAPALARSSTSDSAGGARSIRAAWTKNPVRLAAADLPDAATARRSWRRRRTASKGEIASAARTILSRGPDFLHRAEGRRATCWWSSTQHPTEMQQVVATCSASRPTGGGRDAAHGRRLRRQGVPAGDLRLHRGAAGRQTGRPVKLRLDRDDDMTMTGKRHDFISTTTSATTTTVVILAAAVDMAARCGMSADLTGPVNDRAVFHFDNAYYLENVAIDASQRARPTPSRIPRFAASAGRRACSRSNT